MWYVRSWDSTETSKWIRSKYFGELSWFPFLNFRVTSRIVWRIQCKWFTLALQRSQQFPRINYNTKSTLELLWSIAFRWWFVVLFFFISLFDLRFPVREDPSQAMVYKIPVISYSTPLYSTILCFISRMNLPHFIFHRLIPAVFLVAQCKTH